MLLLCLRLYVVLHGGLDGLHVEGQLCYRLDRTAGRGNTHNRGRLIEQRLRREVHERGILRILVHRGDPKRKRTAYHTQLEVRITAHTDLHRGIVQAGTVGIVTSDIHHACVFICPYGDRGFQHVVIAPAVRQIRHMEHDVEFGFRRDIPRCSRNREARHDHAYGTVVVAVVPIGLIGFKGNFLRDVFDVVCIVYFHSGILGRFAVERCGLGRKRGIRICVRYRQLHMGIRIFLRCALDRLESITGECVFEVVVGIIHGHFLSQFDRIHMYPLMIYCPIQAEIDHLSRSGRYRVYGSRMIGIVGICERYRGACLRIALSVSLELDIRLIIPFDLLLRVSGFGYHTDLYDEFMLESPLSRTNDVTRSVVHTPGQCGRIEILVMPFRVGCALMRGCNALVGVYVYVLFVGLECYDGQCDLPVSVMLRSEHEP